MYSIIENSCKVNYCKYFCQLGDVGKAQTPGGELLRVISTAYN